MCIWLAVCHQGKPKQELKARTQEAGPDAETLEEGCLLTCPATFPYATHDRQPMGSTVLASSIN